MRPSSDSKWKGCHVPLECRQNDARLLNLRPLSVWNVTGVPQDLTCSAAEQHHCSWYSFPIQLRVGGWVGLSSWLHTKTVYLWTVTHLSTTLTWCRVSSLMRPTLSPLGQISKHLCTGLACNDQIFQDTHLPADRMVHCCQLQAGVIHHLRQPGILTHTQTLNSHWLQGCLLTRWTGLHPFPNSAITGGQDISKIWTDFQLLHGFLKGVGYWCSQGICSRHENAAGLLCLKKYFTIS